MKGRLIVFEGLDGVGKSTLSRELAERLDARFLSTPDVCLKETRNAIDVLYAYSPSASHLFYASCVAHASDQAVLENARGRDVVVDRYWLSTWAYNSLRRSPLHLGEVSRQLKAADFTFLLTMDPSERLRRLRERGCTGGDETTLNPLVAKQIDRRFRRGLRTKLAGRSKIVDVTTGGIEAAMRQIERQLA